MPNYVTLPSFLVFTVIVNQITPLHSPFRRFPGLTVQYFYVIFSPVNGFDEDTRALLRYAERSRLVQGFVTYGCDTTSELAVGNGGPGMPVIVHTMSGRLVCNQGGTVEYI